MIFKFLWNRLFIIYFFMVMFWLANMLYNKGVVCNTFLYFFILTFLVILLIYFFFFYNLEKKRNKLNFFILSLLVIESILNLGVLTENINFKEASINSGFGYFNHACAEFNVIRGFKWQNGPHRIVKFNSNETIYDNIFNLNNIGYYSFIDYSYAKNDSAIERYVVLGDSFTSAEYLTSPLTDCLNNNSENIEFYSFSINGGGLENWHSIFFNEIIPFYEFDGVVINVFGNDINRDFFMMHHEDTQGYTSYSKVIPKNTKDYFENYLPLAKPYAPILNDNKIDSIVSLQNKDKFRIDFYVPKLLVYSPIVIFNKIKWHRFIKSIVFKKETNIEYSEIVQFYSQDKLNKFFDIINFCKTNHKKLIVCSVPYEYAIYEEKKGKILKEKAYLNHICIKHDITFFDGYKPFKELDNKTIESLFFKGDTHWNQMGSDLYCADFLNFLKTKN